MKKAFKPTIISFLAIVIIAGSYSYGYCRGYNRASQGASEFELASDVNLHDLLEKKDLDHIHSDLDFVIWADSKYLHKLERAPLGSLLCGFSNTGAETASAALKRADEIIAADQEDKKIIWLGPGGKALNPESGH
jgi:hypothetical protein